MNGLVQDGNGIEQRDDRADFLTAARYEVGDAVATPELGVPSQEQLTARFQFIGRTVTAERTSLLHRLATGLLAAIDLGPGDGRWN